MVRKLFQWQLCVYSLILILSCSRTGPTIKHEELFFLDLGVMGDELDFFERDGTLFFDRKIDILMRDGLFYISNPSLGKIMKFSNYGDILSLIYNEHYNLPFKKNDSNYRVTTWNFQNVGLMAVDSDGAIYVDDRIEVDADLLGPVAFDRVILRFNSNGEYTDFLGQEGKNTSPLPFISELKITKDDDLIATTRNQEDWEIYCYNNAGDLLYPAIILPTSLVRAEDDPSITFAINTIKTDVTGEFLFISAAGLAENKTEVLPRMFVYDIKQRKILRSFLFPLGKLGQGFDLIGSDLNRHLYFVKDIIRNSEQLGYELQVVDSYGNVVRNAILTNQLKEPPISTSMSVSMDGIIYAIFAYRFGAEVVWWRQM